MTIRREVADVELPGGSYLVSENIQEVTGGGYGFRALVAEVRGLAKTVDECPTIGTRFTYRGAGGHARPIEMVVVRTEWTNRAAEWVAHDLFTARWPE